MRDKADRLDVALVPVGLRLIFLPSSFSFLFLPSPPNPARTRPRERER